MSMKLFYVGVKGLIVRDNKVLLLRGDGARDFWDTPGGRIDDDESIEETLRRELSEELPDIRVNSIGDLVHAYRVPGSIHDDIGVTILFYKVDVELDEEVVISEEHTEYRWMTFDEALELAAPGGVREAVRKIRP